MLRSWWDLGEHIGELGSELATYQIECAFCGERGNFSTEHHAEKKKPNSRKVLNFDTLKCGNCAGYVLVLWSAMEHAGSHSLHSYRVVPYPQKITGAPEHWPPEIQRFWLQAQKSLESENWDAAAVMARSAQVALREHKAQGSSLKGEIDDLASRGILHTGNDHSYVYPVRWDHFISNLNGHINFSFEINANAEQYNIVKDV